MLYRVQHYWRARYVEFRGVGCKKMNYRTGNLESGMMGVWECLWDYRYYFDTRRVCCADDF